MAGAIMSYVRTETLLSVESVTLTANSITPGSGDNVILRDINVKVDNLVRPGHHETTGQIIAFLGPSGIGKTQFLRILAGLQKPTTGNVFLGQDRKTVVPGLVGMVAQKYYLFMHRTVMSNLMISAMQIEPDETKAMEKCKAMLDRFDLANKADLYPAQLSGGQQQRVAIAQQLLCSEHFLLMDEPTAGLDIKNKNRVAKLVQEVAAQDDLNTIIIVTHDIASAVAIADTVWIMGRDRDEAGEIIPGARIIEQYDLIEMGLMWHPEVRRLPLYNEVVHEIESKFDRL